MDDDFLADLGPSASDTAALDCETYEEYLDHQISEKDLFYLEDEDLARQLVELGCSLSNRGGGDILRRTEFEARKKAAENARASKLRNAPPRLAHTGKGLEGRPFLKMLADREEYVLSGKLAVIIFIRDRNSKGQEVSGYIDFGHRLKTESFEQYFSGKKLLPKPSDLSYYNWETGMCTMNSTPNFEVIAESEVGLLFKNKRDRKVVNVDPKADPGDNSRRVECKTHEYVQVVVWDHVTRRKN